MTAGTNEFFPRLDVACLSDRGAIRENNEDALLAMPDEGCFLVTDGMGGGDAGEDASRIVVEALSEALRGCGNSSPGERKLIVQQALLDANSRSGRYRMRHGYDAMGSTVVLLLLDSWDPQTAQVCHVGDSRMYCFRNRELFRLTEDHNVRNELKVKCPMRVGGMNALTRAIGVADTVRPEWHPISLCRDDILLLCSDGVSSMLSDEVLTETIADGGESGEIVSRIRDKVFQRGAEDNFSMICIRIISQPPPRQVGAEDVLESDYLLNHTAERISCI